MEEVSEREGKRKEDLFLYFSLFFPELSSSLKCQTNIYAFRDKGFRSKLVYICTFVNVHVCEVESNSPVCALKLTLILLWM